MEPFLLELPYHIYDWLIIKIFVLLSENGQLFCHLRVMNMIILRLLLLLTNLHLKLLSTQGTGADELLSTQRVKIVSIIKKH